MEPNRLHPFEQALRRAVVWILAGAAVGSIVVGLMPAPGPDDGLFAYAMAHLTALVLYAGVHAWSQWDLLHQPGWFASLTPVRRRLWSLVAVVVLTTAVGGLVALPTVAAARYDVSMQYLQILSAIDIAWVVGGSLLGARRLGGRIAGVGAWAIMTVLCIASIWRYLDVVGFTETGGWLVDGDAMLRIVITADAMGALIAISLMVAGSIVDGRRRAAEPAAATS